MAIITLLTDYGTRDYYVAALKGVIATISPGTPVVDLTHHVEPFNVAQAAFVLWQSWSWFPVGTIHVAVVDPGVGSKRRILLAGYRGQFVLAPDNGLVTWLHREYGAEVLRAVENPEYGLPMASSTFHGRDLLAPAAAHLANGVAPDAFGPVMDRPELLPVQVRAERTADGWVGQVVHVDRFGTLVTNVREDQLRSGPGGDRPWEVSVNGAAVGAVRSSFHEVPPGSPVAFLGGSGFLEIAVHRGRAVDRFGPVEAVRIHVS